MNNIVLGQYVEKNSLIHKLDPRCKLLMLILLMVSVFIIPSPIDVEEKWIPFMVLSCYMLLVIIIVILSKVSIIAYLKSIRQIFFIIALAFVLQIFTKTNDGITFNIPVNLSLFGILSCLALLVIYILTFKKNPFRVLTFFGIVVLGIYILTFKFNNVLLFKATSLAIYKTGLYNGAFFSFRIFIIISFSTSFSLTTKPNDLSKAIESLLKPLTLFKINVSIFAMMISLALRFIPTLFNEANKILKAQASRGVDFNEGTLKDKISQIVSLIIPMFVISYKKADDLALAMDARGYIPENKRTSILELKFKFKDVVSLFIALALFAFTIVWRVIA